MEGDDWVAGELGGGAKWSGSGLMTLLRCMAKMSACDLASSVRLPLLSSIGFMAFLGFMSQMSRMSHQNWAGE